MAGRVVFLLAEVAYHLLSRGAFQDGLGHLGQQSARAEQFHALGLGLGEQLIGQFVIDQRPARRLPAIRLREPWLCQ
jgi:hypothetical protein